MRVLVFGSNGQVAHELRRRGPGAGAEIIALGRDACDLMQAGAANAAIGRTKPDAVINASAYTAVDKAESERDLAMRLNGAAPGEMAKACAALGVPLIHFSTDYVFDGAGSRPYREDHPVAPLGAYGETKLDGERRVSEAGGASAIIRLSWVFSAYGANFVKTMLRLGAERPSLRVVADQRGKPTPASSAADAALIAAKVLRADGGKAGVYHFAGDEETSWAGFAEAIMRAANFPTPVEHIGTKDYPTPAKRPAYSVLDTGKFEQAFGVKAPSWRRELKEVVRDLSATAGGE